MINMAFMPLYMWEMWDVTPVTDEHTDSRKVEQYSVWTESAIWDVTHMDRHTHRHREWKYIFFCDDIVGLDICLCGHLPISHLSVFTSSKYIFVWRVMSSSEYVYVCNDIVHHRYLPVFTYSQYMYICLTSTTGKEPLWSCWDFSQTGSTGRLFSVWVSCSVSTHTFYL